MSKTVFLTGGSSGIGQAISKQLSEDGWRVIAPSHKVLDLANLGEVAKFNLPAKEIDAFIHVAGIWHTSNAVLADKAFGSFSAEQIIQTMSVGISAPMILINKLLAEGHPSSIIAISGTFESGAKGWLPYYTSKRALEDFLTGLSQDNENLSVYGISPADTDTPAYRRFYPEYVKDAQPTYAVAKLVQSLLEKREKYSNGSIIELRNGEHKPGFHS